MIFVIFLVNIVTYLGIKLDQELQDIFSQAQEGLVQWEKADYLSAFQIWGKLYKRNPEAFISFKPLANLIRDKQKESIQEQIFENDLVELITKYQSNTLEPEFAHTAFAKLLFAAGLLPQHWFEFEDLKSALSLWKREASKQPFFPYNGYILGILYCYCGLYNEAMSFLQKSFDHIPSSKRKALKIEELIRLSKKVIGEPKKQTLANEQYSEESWLALGFEKDDELVNWRASGLSPELAREWKKQNFTAKQASRWSKGEFELEQALLWREKLSEDPVFATQCKVAGFSDPGVAANWMKIFTFPSEAMRWIENGFSSKDAAVWMRQGVTDPLEALKRKMH